MIPSFLIPIIGVVIVVFIAFYGFTTRGYMVHAVLLAAPFVLFLINRPQLLLMLLFGLYPSNIILPGLPSGLQLVHLMMFFFIGLTIAHTIISKPGRVPFRATHSTMLMLLAVLMITIYFRGLGLYSSGTGLVGGAAYIKFFAGAGLLYCVRYYTLSIKQMKVCLLLIVIGTLLPFLAQMVFLLSGGAIYQHFFIIQPYVYGLVESLTGTQEGTGMVRFHALAGVSISLLGAALVVMPFRGVINFRLIAVTLFCLVLATYSGFRISVVEIGVILFLFILFSARKQDRTQYAVGMLAAAFVGLLVTIPLVPYLPYTVQRALSFLPFAEVSAMVRLDASESTAWRFEVWEFALQHWKEYMWVGRGFTINLAEIMSLSNTYDLVLYAYVSHNYHSGPISLLLDLGIPGFVAGTLFIIACISFSMKPLDPDADPFMRRFYNLYRAKTLYAAFGFFLIIGDAKSSFIVLSMNLAILELIRNSVAGSLRKNEAAAQPDTVPAPRPTARIASGKRSM